MKKNMLSLALSLALVFAAAWQALAAEPLRVFVSIAPAAYFVEQVAGPLASVEVLVPPGKEPHNFEPTPKQMALVSRAKIYFSLGIPFEGSLTKRLAQVAPGLKVVDAAHGVPRLAMGGGKAHKHGGHGGHGENTDPHIWLSPGRVKIIAANMAKALIKADPANKEKYQANLAGFEKRLAALDSGLARALAPYKGRAFLVYHPAFGYLAHDYGLRQIAIQAQGKEPGPKGLARLIDFARKHKVKVIFIEPQFPRQSAAAVARAIGGVVTPVDPLARDWEKGLRRLAAELAKGLGEGGNG